MHVNGACSDLCFLLPARRQTLEDGRYDAVLSYSMPGNDLDSCGCVLAHKLGVPLMSVHAIPFLLLPLAAKRCYLDEKALLVGGALPTIRCAEGRQGLHRVGRQRQLAVVLPAGRPEPG